MDNPIDAVEAVKNLSRALQTLRAVGVIRSSRYTGDLGEWYVEQLYQMPRTASQTQKGWDFRLPASGERLQVKTQTYDRNNRWNYLDTDPALFDRLILVILTPTLTLRDLYDIPSTALLGVLRTGKEGKPTYYWDTLAPWRVDP